MNNDIDSNQPQNKRMPWELLKPSWDDWKSVKQAKLWEAASLACDLDPLHIFLFPPDLIRGSLFPLTAGIFRVGMALSV